MWLRIAASLLFVCLAAGRSEGRLILADQVRDGIDGADGLSGARGLAISPDGHHVYVVAVGDDSVAVFSRSPLTGALSVRQVLRDGEGPIDGLDRPTVVVVSHDGRFVYVAGGFEDAIAVFSRDIASGQLTFVTVYLGVGAAEGAAQPVSAIALSADGANLYAAGQAPLLITFARDPVTGLLTSIDVEKNGLDGVEGLTSLGSIVIMPDGGRLYGLGPQTLVAFTRLADGKLEFLTRALMPIEEGAITAGAIALAPGGIDLYGTADTGQTIGGVVSLLREGATPGTLTLIGPLSSSNGVAGLGMPRDLAVSPDGAFVFVGGITSAVGAFRRGSDGSLTFSEQQNVGLDAVFSLAVTSDSKYLYAAGANSNSVVAFRIAPDEGPLEIPALSTAGIAAMVAAFCILVPLVTLRRHRRAR